MSTELLKAMMAPSLYEHSTSGFTLLETHISWVLLTGDYVYKIKKPMDFGFLDFSSLEKRKKYCDMELKLNRRLAPDLYESVIPISGSANSPKINDDSEVFEYAIRMRQFPLDAVFETMYKKRQLPKKYLLDVASQLADFHSLAEKSPDNSPYGSPEHVWFPVHQNFEQIRPLLKDEGDIQQLDKIEDWTTNEYQNNLPIIKERKTRGYIKACHGDVHLGNIALFNNKITLFDGIEFNEDFRWTDTMADLGFLVMDLESKGLSDYAAAVIDSYMENSGDCCGLALLSFYKSYRAMVKAKVALFKLYSEGVDEKVIKEAFTEYRHYSALAESYCQKHKPVLMVTNGLSGSGKSTVSDYIVTSLQAIRLRSDVERKRLFGLKANESSKDLNEDIYTEDVTAQNSAAAKVIVRNIGLMVCQAL